MVACLVTPASSPVLPSPTLDVYFVHIDVDIVESFLREVS
jgi:hypothetical protein